MLTKIVITRLIRVSGYWKILNAILISISQNQYQAEKNAKTGKKAKT